MNDESYVHVQEYWYLYEYLIYFLHEFISFKDMLSYKELNYDVYIYKSTETDYFITLFFINNYDEIWFICQLSISILKIQYEHVLLLDRFFKKKQSKFKHSKSDCNNRKLNPIRFHLIVPVWKTAKISRFFVSLLGMFIRESVSFIHESHAFIR